MTLNHQYLPGKVKHKDKKIMLMFQKDKKKKLKLIKYNIIQFGLVKFLLF